MKEVTNLKSAKASARQGKLRSSESRVNTACSQSRLAGGEISAITTKPNMNLTHPLLLIPGQPPAPTLVLWRIHGQRVLAETGSETGGWVCWPSGRGKGVSSFLPFFLDAFPECRAYLPCRPPSWSRWTTPPVGWTRLQTAAQVLLASRVHDMFA